MPKMPCPDAICRMRLVDGRRHRYIVYYAERLSANDAEFS